MTEELKNALSLLNSYMSDFADKGYDADRAGRILSAIGSNAGNMLGSVSSVFGCNDLPYMPVRINAAMSERRIKELCTKLLLSGVIPVISADGPTAYPIS